MQHCCSNDDMFKFISIKIIHLRFYKIHCSTPLCREKSFAVEFFYHLVWGVVKICNVICNDCSDVAIVLNMQISAKVVQNSPAVLGVVLRLGMLFVSSSFQ